MRRLVSRDIRVVLERKPNIIETIQQAMPHEVIDRKARMESPIVAHLGFFQIDGERIVVDLIRPLHDLGDFVFR